MKKIDAHHHLWKFNTRDYGWMDDSMDVLKKDYLPKQLSEKLNENHIEGTIVVQARQLIEETEWLLSLTDQFTFIKGVVGWVDLQSDQLIDQLEKYGRHEKLVGVRHVIHDEPDVNFMLNENFVKGIAQLVQYDLSYDLLLFPEHLENASKLVRKFPNQRFVLDHIGKPCIKSGEIEPWKSNLLEFAKVENVYCKVSGMVTEADHSKWKYADFVPYLDAVVEAFGTERIMLGSDWPVCRLAAEYDDVINIALKYFGDFSEVELDKILRSNAKSFYRID